ncbi:MAG: hypothetical protein QP798_07090 [Staphylococcus simulans]|uniref:hypothetical protein n=1 Tax=Staphylococcus simulans TaxID=1286 RepID=UPI002556B12C|nr:hypothetical protein [Staphylococcus simulans]MDK7927106.1 hypothetical protein [Staphylococcus simulans]MDK8315695.1 hypothetical protein [Staphylococcus simulans]
MSKLKEIKIALLIVILVEEIKIATYKRKFEKIHKELLALKTEVTEIQCKCNQ